MLDNEVTLKFGIDLTCHISLGPSLHIAALELLYTGNPRSYVTSRPRGYKTVFMLNSAELGIYPAHIC